MVVVRLAGGAAATAFQAEQNAVEVANPAQRAAVAVAVVALVL